VLISLFFFENVTCPSPPSYTKKNISTLCDHMIMHGSVFKPLNQLHLENFISHSSESKDPAEHMKRLHVITVDSKQACPIIMPVHLSLNSPEEASSITVTSKEKTFYSCGGNSL
jgi:hypothetical protein